MDGGPGRREEQSRIRRLENRGLDDRRIAAEAPAILDPLLLRIVDEGSIDALERLGTHELDVALERGPLRRRVGHADQAERAVALRVDKVKCQAVVAEAVRLLDHEGAEHLLAAHPVTAAFRVDAAREQIGLDPARELRMRIEDRAHRLELANVVVAEWDWNE